MKTLTVKRCVAIAAFWLGSAIGAPLWAQAPVRVTIPASDFTLEGRVGQFNDVAGGRRFHGPGNAVLQLRATLRMPPAGSADLKIQRLVVHFRAEQSVSSLRSVEVLNGGTSAFKIGVNLNGDYSAPNRETTKPDFVANAWDLKSSPRAVSARSVIRLEVQLGGGYEGTKGSDFLLNSVVVDFPGKLPPVTSPTRPMPSLPPSVPSLPPASVTGTPGTIYAVNANNELIWYRYGAQSDGTLTWIEPKPVGSGWSVAHVFPGGDGVIYGITSTGDLLWFRHDGRANGTKRWTGPVNLGPGWDLKQVFSGGGGVFYGITSDGALNWYRHEGYRDGSPNFAPSAQVGSGWSFKHVFSPGEGVIYAISSRGELMWYHHDGYKDGTEKWSGPINLGGAWGRYKQVFSGGGGVIYAITMDGDLLRFRHDGYRDGSKNVIGPQNVGSGWAFKYVISD